MIGSQAASSQRADDLCNDTAEANADVVPASPGTYTPRRTLCDIGNIRSLTRHDFVTRDVHRNCVIDR
jgi:hypothetical protein